MTISVHQSIEQLNKLIHAQEMVTFRGQELTSNTLERYHLELLYTQLPLPAIRPTPGF